MTTVKPFVRASDHAYAAVGFLHILYQPVDGVPTVGGIVGAGIVIARTERRRGHQIGSLGAVLATHVLINADIACPHKVLIREW